MPECTKRQKTAVQFHLVQTLVYLRSSAYRPAPCAFLNLVQLLTSQPKPFNPQIITQSIQHRPSKPASTHLPLQTWPNLMMTSSAMGEPSVNATLIWFLTVTTTIATATTIRHRAIQTKITCQTTSWWRISSPFNIWAAVLARRPPHFMDTVISSMDNHTTITTVTTWWVSSDFNKIV